MTPSLISNSIRCLYPACKAARNKVYSVFLLFLFFFFSSHKRVWHLTACFSQTCDNTRTQLFVGALFFILLKCGGSTNASKLEMNVLVGGCEQSELNKLSRGVLFLFWGISFNAAPLTEPIKTMSKWVKPENVIWNIDNERQVYLFKAVCALLSLLLSYCALVLTAD